jgi:hypothetical protein
MEWPVIYTPDAERSLPVIHLQCLSGIHFNALSQRRMGPLVSLVKQMNINSVLSVARGVMGVFHLSGVSSDSEDSDGESPLIQSSSVKCIVSRNELLEAQNNDDVLCLLKRKLINKIDFSQRMEECLKPFKTGRTLRVVSDLLVIDHHDLPIPVADMQMLIDTSMRIHCDLAHIGNNKLTDIVSKHFFHHLCRK